MTAELAQPRPWLHQFCFPVSGSNFGIGWPVLASNLGANAKLEELEPEVEATAAGCATPMTAAFMALEELAAPTAPLQVRPA